MNAESLESLWRKVRAEQKDGEQHLLSQEEARRFRLICELLRKEHGDDFLCAEVMTGQLVQSGKQYSVGTRLRFESNEGYSVTRYSRVRGLDDYECSSEPGTRFEIRYPTHGEPLLPPVGFVTSVYLKHLLNPLTNAVKPSSIVMYLSAGGLRVRFDVDLDSICIVESS